MASAQFAPPFTHSTAGSNDQFRSRVDCWLDARASSLVLLALSYIDDEEQLPVSYATAVAQEAVVYLFDVACGAGSLEERQKAAAVKLTRNDKGEPDDDNGFEAIGLELGRMLVWAVYGDATDPSPHRGWGDLSVHIPMHWNK